MYFLHLILSVLGSSVIDRPSLTVSRHLDAVSLQTSRDAIFYLGFYFQYVKVAVNIYGGVILSKKS